MKILDDQRHHPAVIVEARVLKVGVALDKKKGTDILNENKKGVAAAAETVKVDMSREGIDKGEERAQRINPISLNPRATLALSAMKVGCILKAVEEVMVDNSGTTLTGWRGMCFASYHSDY